MSSTGNGAAIATEKGARVNGLALALVFKATTMLKFVAAAASLMCLVVMVTYAQVATPLGGTITLPGSYVAPLTMGFIPAAAAISLGLFNSIKFPTIFTLTRERSSAPGVSVGH